MHKQMNSVDIIIQVQVRILCLPIVWISATDPYSFTGQAFLSNIICMLSWFHISLHWYLLLNITCIFRRRRKRQNVSHASYEDNTTDGKSSDEETLQAIKSR
jgi:hypothetical protein